MASTELLCLTLGSLYNGETHETHRMDMSVHAFNLSTWEVEAGGPRNSRSSSTEHQVSQNEKKKKMG